MCAWPTASTRSKNWGTETLTDTDLEAQLDLLHDWMNAAFDSSSGHKHDGTTSEGPQIALSGGSQGVTGTLGLGNGGTGQTTLAGLLNLVYPVGSLYFQVAVSTNPGTLLGFGTWTAFGAGKTLVGLDSGDTDFDTVEETGGAKTVSTAHTHGITGTYSANWAQDTGLTHVAGVIPNEGSSPITTDSQSVSSVSIVQPYVVVYMWKRTA